MSEKEKMLQGHLFHAYDRELYKEREYCQCLLYEYNRLNPMDKKNRKMILNKLLNCQGEHCIEQPFHCSYGYNITIGIDFYSDVNLTIIDKAPVFIGNHVIVGANVSIYTTAYPYNDVQRIKGFEYAKSVKIFDNVWIGGNVTILPGVRINQGAMIESGSVVTHDIPPYAIASGNPCEVVRFITKEDLHKKW